MVEISPLRLARLKKGLTLDDLLLRSAGRLSPARLSRIERGICNPSPMEAQLLIELLGVEESTMKEATLTVT
jgi:transcriptional regulator with XRE-family HTH domain